MYSNVPDTWLDCFFSSIYFDDKLFKKEKGKQKNYLVHYTTNLFRITLKYLNSDLE